MRDIVVAFRQFSKSPGYAVTVVLTLALGIGANTAIFTLVHAVLMKSLPVADPKTLYRVGDLEMDPVSREAMRGGQRIELTAKPLDGYWEQRGYDRDAWVGRSNGRG